VRGCGPARLVPQKAGETETDPLILVGDVEEALSIDDRDAPTRGRSVNSRMNSPSREPEWASDGSTERKWVATVHRRLRGNPV
jgi:hypothetical protein